MRLTWILSVLVLPLATFGAKKPEGDRFIETYSKALPAWLDDYSYQKLTTAPRDYAIAVLLTALEPRFGCTACREFQSEWDILAKSWQKGDRAGESRMIFSTLDFADGKGTFQSVCLFCKSLRLRY